MTAHANVLDVLKRARGEGEEVSERQRCTESALKNTEDRLRHFDLVTQKVLATMARALPASFEGARQGLLAMLEVLRRAGPGTSGTVNLEAGVAGAGPTASELEQVLMDFDSKVTLGADELRKEGRDEEARHWAFKLRQREEECEKQRLRDKEAYECLKT